MRLLLLALVLPLGLMAQGENKAEKEDAELELALAEAGNSSIEYARALERHIAKYPESERRAEMERVILQAAIDLKDNRRILRHGVWVVENGTRSPQVLDHVSRALLDSGNKEDQERALRYARLLEEELNKLYLRLTGNEEEINNRGRRVAEAEKGLSRALTFQARAMGNLGNVKEAAAAAKKAWDLYPSSEAGRELSRWLEPVGDIRAALDAVAAATAASETLPDDPERRKDRARMTALAGKAGVAEVELGQIALRASDDVARRLAERRARLEKLDPNTFASKPLDFTLSGLKGELLDLSSLKGKVVVFDFWATWCGPCRGQYPLYEQVKRRFEGRAEVVFLAVSTDEDREAVAPFLESNKWSKSVYFEDGLATFLRVNSIPTTVVLGRGGEVYSRLQGYIAGRFVDMLSDRIEEALQLD